MDKRPTRGLLKSVDALVRNELKNDDMTYGGPTDFMRQLDDLQLLLASMVSQARNLAWQLEYRVKAKINERRKPAPSPLKDGGSEA